jgi:hypothetical protein
MMRQDQRCGGLNLEEGGVHFRLIKIKFCYDRNCDGNARKHQLYRAHRPSNDTGARSADSC